MISSSALSPRPHLKHKNAKVNRAGTTGGQHEKTACRTRLLTFRRVWRERHKSETFFGEAPGYPAALRFQGPSAGYDMSLESLLENLCRLFEKVLLEKDEFGVCVELIVDIIQKLRTINTVKNNMGPCGPRWG